MNPHLLFNFDVNKEEKTIHIDREFNAQKDLVWSAWTTAEILDQWWAPKPYQNKTKFLDLRAGGQWLYCMVSPTNEVHWCLADYIEVNPTDAYSGYDAFCDESGTINTAMPRTLWNVNFEAKGETTVVHITLKYETLEALEMIISMGFKEGLSMGFGNLDNYIEAQFKLRHEMGKNAGARVCTYVNFPGNTEEAFLFYRSVFQTEFVAPGIQRFGDLPAQEGQPPVSDELKKMVLHIELPITANHILMGTDAPKEMGFTVTQGNNMHISIEPSSREEAKRIFDQLSSDGTISMPLQDMFWGAYFGSFTDKYGINWMVNFRAQN